MKQISISLKDLKKGPSRSKTRSGTTPNVSDLVMGLKESGSQLRQPARASGLTQEKLKQRLNYDKDTGSFTWERCFSTKIKPGQAAGTVGNHGYLQISLDRKIYLAHRLAWLYEYGAWPEIVIDHINGDKLDNRIENLRSVDQKINCANNIARKQKDFGVYWFARTGKWRARLYTTGVDHHLGFYDNKNEALAVVRKARKALNI